MKTSTLLLVCLGVGGAAFLLTKTTNASGGSPGANAKIVGVSQNGSPFFAAAASLWVLPITYHFSDGSVVNTTAAYDAQTYTRGASVPIDDPNTAPPDAAATTTLLAFLNSKTVGLTLAEASAL